MISESAYGKINLAMRIVGRRPDGYHEVDTVYQSVALHDTVTIEESSVFRLTADRSDLVCDETNLAYKAYKALAPFCEVPRPVHIRLEKRLPVAAGLAGGSADCAAVLRGLNRFWDLNLKASDLERIGAALGADVPFCVTGGTVRGSGIGDILTPLPSLPAWEVLILHPHVCVETGKAYDLFDKAGSVSFVDVGEMVDSVRGVSFDGICRAMGNTFESFIVPLVPEVSECKEALSRLGLNPLMSGSGPTVFALVPPERDGSFFARRLEKEMKNTDVMLTSLI